ncbi:MAG TPA: hypothetical protein VGF55_17270 [Gemmataceae bacterium]
MAPLVAWLLVLLTLAVAGVFARQQVNTLRGLPARTEVSEEDRTYFRRQAWRRLVGCVLLVAIAAMMSVWFLSGQHIRIDEVGDDIQARKAAHEQPTLEQEQARRFFAYYWISVLSLLMVLVILAVIDLNAIRRFAARHVRQIRDDRRAMLERELAELRRQRGLGRGEPSEN